MILKLAVAALATALVLLVALRKDTYGYYVRLTGWRLVRPEWVTVFDRDASPLRVDRIELPCGWVAYRNNYSRQL